MIWPVILFVALLVLPGALLGWAGGLRPGWALASGPALTFGVTGLAGWLFGAVGVGYSTLTAGLLWLVLVLVALVWRRFVPNRVPTADGRASESGGIGKRVLVALPAVGGVLAAFVTLAYAALSRIERVPEGMESIQQSWDVHWHASVIRYILDTGMASSTRMGEIQNFETGKAMYYPAAWHAFGANFAEVSGQTVPAAVNILGLVAPALLVPVAAAAFAWRIVDRAGWTASIAAGLAAVITTAMPVLAPIGTYVGAWPYQVGIALTAVTFALLTSVPHAPVRMFAAALALIGIGQLHPSAVPATLFVVFAWWLLGRVWRPVRPELGAVRSRLRDIGLIALPGIAAAVFLAPQWLSASAQAEDVRAESATVDVNRFGAWYRAVTLLTRHAEDFGVINLAVITALVGLGLAVVLLRRPWPLLAWAMAVTFTAHALNPFGTFAGGILDIYNGLHYATPHRLVQSAALLLAAGGGAGIAALLGLPAALAARRKKTDAAGEDAADDGTAGTDTATDTDADADAAGDTTDSVVAVDEAVDEKTLARERFRVPVAQLLVAAVLAGAFIPAAVQRMSPLNDYVYRDVRDGRVISERDLRAFDWLADQPEAMRHRVFTNPNEGSGWMYPRNDIPTVFRHFVWPDADKHSATSMVYWHPDKIGWGQPWEDRAANDVDWALKKLGVSFVYVSPPYFWPDQRINERMLTGIWWARGLTPVYRDEEVVIYAVNWMVSPERIQAMRAQSPEHMPPMLTRADAGLAKPGDPDADDPFAYVPDFDLYRPEGMEDVN